MRPGTMRPSAAIEVIFIVLLGNLGRLGRLARSAETVGRVGRQLHQVKFLQQSFERQPQYTEANPGEPTVLTCQVLDKSPNSICVWQKDGKPLRMQQFGKYEWYGSPDYGDCSLRIFGSDLDHDDGEWECQVTASSYDADDALSSRPARLVVRVPPEDPQVFREGQALHPEDPMVVTAGEQVSFRCDSHSGNPPAVLKWYINDVEVTGARQRNETDLVNRRKWNAVSVVDVTFNKDDNDKELRCVALHEAYPQRSREKATRVDVQYPPIVSLSKAEGQGEFEADVDSATFSCMADANPSPTVIWRKAGEESIFRIGQHLKFQPVRRGDGGTYFCSARNDVGASDELSLTFSVLYEPFGIRTLPQSGVAELGVGESARFECQADGNPKPTFEWLQKVIVGEAKGPPHVEGPGPIISRGHGTVLAHRNVSYEDQGIWVCQAINRLKGRERRVQSEAIFVRVSGRPQFILDDDNMEKNGLNLWFPKDSDGLLSVHFCSDPSPLGMQWEVEASLKLEQGQTFDRFQASNITRDSKMKGCYRASLRISKLRPDDTRMYLASVFNERGSARQGIYLNVSDPISMTAVVGLVWAALVVIVVACIAMAFLQKWRGRICCFRRNEATDGTTISNHGILKSKDEGPFGSVTLTLPSPVGLPDRFQGLPRVDGIPRPNNVNGSPSATQYGEEDPVGPRPIPPPDYSSSDAGCPPRRTRPLQSRAQELGGFSPHVAVPDERLVRTRSWTLHPPPPAPVALGGLVPGALGFRSSPTTKLVAFEEEVEPPLPRRALRIPQNLDNLQDSNNNSSLAGKSCGNNEFGSSDCNPPPSTLPLPPPPPPPAAAAPAATMSTSTRSASSFSSSSSQLRTGMFPAATSTPRGSTALMGPREPPGTVPYAELCFAPLGNLHPHRRERLARPEPEAEDNSWRAMEGRKSAKSSAGTTATTTSTLPNEQGVVQAWFHPGPRDQESSVVVAPAVPRNIHQNYDTSNPTDAHNLRVHDIS